MKKSALVDAADTAANPREPPRPGALLASAVLPFLLEEPSATGDAGLLEYALVVAAAVLLGVILVSCLRRCTSMGRRRGRRASLPQERDPSAERLRMELGQFAREIESRLDTKMACLQRLIEEADAAARRLEALGERGFAEAPAAPEGEQRQERAELREAERGGALAGDSPASPPERDRIVELFRAGRRPPEIAEAVGLPAGEVELVINLYQTEKSR